jgi:hypothetical protein
LAEFTASRARRRGEQTSFSNSFSASENLQSCDLWDILNVARTHFEKNSEIARAGREEKGVWGK